MEAQRKRSRGSMHFLLQGPVCWPCSPLCPILPALTLNSLGTVSFGVARPRKESRPQPSSMARTEEKSPSTLRTWPHSGHSVRFRPTSPLLLHPFPCTDRAQGQEPALSRRKVTLTTEGKKRLAFTCLRAVAKRKEVRKRRREKKAMSGTVWQLGPRGWPPRRAHSGGGSKEALTRPRSCVEGVIRDGVAE